MKHSNKLSLNKLKLLRKLHKKKYRDQFGLYLCEGFRLFQAAVTTPNLKIQEVIIEQSNLTSERKQYIINQCSELNIPIYYGDQSLFKKITTEMTPQGVLFTVQMPNLDSRLYTRCNSGTIIYLDKVANPGNLGTILRSAMWFGVTHILLSPDSVDPYNPKVISASAGAIFRCEIYKDIDFNTMQKHYKQKSYSILATTPSGGTFLHEWKATKKTILCFGQEASGLSLDIINKADTLLTIKNHGLIESLNLSVTAGIILYHMREMHKT